MGRLVSHWVYVLALVPLSVGGCSDETTGTGGAGGSGDAGTGGMGGVGGSCEATVCPCDEAGVRAAVVAGGGPYTFDCNGPTTVVTEAEIEIDNDVILDGEGNLTVDGDRDHRVFSVPRGVTAELHGFTVTRGGAGFPGRTVAGGGILNEGTLTLTNSTVSGNTAGNVGGGISNSGQLTLTNSTVSGNAAAVGGGILHEQGNLTLTNSTVSGNTASADGGGIFSYSVDPTMTNSTVTLTNSTVSGNTAGNVGGGIHSGGGTVTLTNSTVSGNTAALGGGIHVAVDGGTVTLTDSLVEGDCAMTFLGFIVSNGYNIESPGDTCGFDQSTDQASATAEQLNLGELADNGGPTMTHALLPGSVAIDVIPSDMCEVSEDQRGEPRPGGAMCDVGGFEVQP